MKLSDFSTINQVILGKQIFQGWDKEKIIDWWLCAPFKDYGFDKNTHARFIECLREVLNNPQEKECENEKK